jgi:hypothetical protein
MNEDKMKAFLLKGGITAAALYGDKVLRVGESGSGQSRLSKRFRDPQRLAVGDERDPLPQGASHRPLLVKTAKSILAYYKIRYDTAI